MKLKFNKVTVIPKDTEIDPISDTFYREVPTTRALAYIWWHRALPRDMQYTVKVDTVRGKQAANDAICTEAFMSNVPAETDEWGTAPTPQGQPLVLHRNQQG